ncbi:hypothetical protein Goarm_009127 [Gossypium armourianum]|uniref:Uncharacterized protein n=1 Tax=Gossypium armourianum TaxID=34283 RepID=A0A7J9JS12_9ROSI|nr:hypothetical protein [Gossypium armourianum]
MFAMERMWCQMFVMFWIRSWNFQRKFSVAPPGELPLVKKFGIDPNDAFAFWDWVGGHYSGKFLSISLVPVKD